MTRNFVTTSFLMFISCLLLSSCGKDVSPSATVKSYYEALESNDIEQVLALISEEDLAEIDGPKLPLLLSEDHAAIKKEGGIQYIKIEEEDIQGDTAKVEFVWKTEAEEESSDYFDLVLEGGNWRIDLF